MVSSPSSPVSPPPPPQPLPAEVLYVAGQGKILPFAINSDGSLSALTPVTGPGNPTVFTGMMTVSPDKKFLFVGDSVGGPVDVFSIASSGNLNPVSGSPFSGEFNGEPATSGLVTDPTGKFLYFATQLGFEIFMINDQTGAVTGIPGSPFPESNAAIGVAIDSSGKFIYTNDNRINGMAVSGFAIDPNAGTLSLLPDSPFTTTLNSIGPARIC